jgi:hypothetical protein
MPENNTSSLGVEPRVIVCALAILVPPFVAFLVLNAVRSGGLSEDAASYLLLGGCAIGWTCLGFFKTPRRVAKWIWFAFYPLLAWITVGVVDLSVNGFHLRLF